ncbi:MAG: thiamine pyrophosphate-dependent dehydrogenase E1 component subunit alpha [Gemmatimonadetes bacterium]|nr:thiamine pyrophosphate-dependent dehydrogenase E1 component subunit alpha [Gemmatimonadota bacterium]
MTATLDSLRVERALALEFYETMALIRRFEESAYRAYEEGDISGTVHVSIGQEAVAAGVIGALEDRDKVISHHRGHGHAIARGVPVEPLMAELCGRSCGSSGGKGGSMHVTDVDRGFLGTMAVVGSAVPIAAGVALASKLKGAGEVCVVFFGDGAVNQGVLYESFNLAVLWSLPVVFVCENNSYAITMPVAESTAGSGVAARARAFGISDHIVDGQDVLEVYDTARRAVEHARGGRPSVIEALTYRFMGHSRGDPPHGLYRVKEEVEAWRQRDPIAILAEVAGLSPAAADEITGRVEARVDQALAYARGAAEPGDPALYRDIWG